MTKHYVQYGCGLSAPPSWRNYDASPTLRIQRTPLLGELVKGKLNVNFPEGVLFGDITRGLPEAPNSCDGLYCSHVLEHLSLEDFRKALENTLTILKPGGIFRCVVPDLEYAARKYIAALDQGDTRASLQFCGEDTLLGVEKRPRGAKGMITSFLSNAHHLWMWDSKSLAEELRKAGFHQIRSCTFNDCEDPAFRDVEDEGRFIHAVAMESRK